MVEGSEVSNKTNGKSILLSLRSEQLQVKDHSTLWIKLQQQIDKIVAQQYLEWLNR